MAFKRCKEHNWQVLYRDQFRDKRLRCGVCDAVADAVFDERKRCADICQSYAAAAHVKAMHVQYDTARFLQAEIENNQ